VLFVGVTQQASLPAVADGMNTWRLAAGGNVVNGLGETAFFTLHAVAGTTAVSVDFSGGATNVDLRILEYAGLGSLDSANSLDGAVSAGNGRVTTNPGLVTSPPSLVVAGYIVSGMFVSAAPGFSAHVVSSDGNFTLDRVETAPGSYSADAVQTNMSGAYSSQLLVFRGQ
jgi:hypothetical protein